VDRFDLSPAGQDPVQSSVALGPDGRGAVVWTLTGPSGQALLCRTLLLKPDDLETGEAFPLALPVPEIHDPILLADAAGRLTCFFLARTQSWRPMMVPLEPGEPPTAGPATPLADEGQASYLTAARQGDGVCVQWRKTLETGPPELARLLVGGGRKPSAPSSSGGRLPGDLVGSGALASSSGAPPGLVVCQDTDGYRLVLVSEGRE
jgi:hypothetical protein